MTASTSLVVGAVSTLGLELVSFKPKRGFAELGSDTIALAAMAVVREKHLDEIEITQHPIENGADITDHAYVKPAMVTLDLAWSASPNNIGYLTGIANTVNAALNLFAPGGGVGYEYLQFVYNSLLKIQRSRELFTLFTGKRVYQNMLIKSLAADTTAKTENSLFATVVCQQLIIVETVVTTVPVNPQAQANPAATTPPVNNGTKQLQPGALYTPPG